MQAESQSSVLHHFVDLRLKGSLYILRNLGHPNLGHQRDPYWDMEV